MSDLQIQALVLMQMLTAYHPDLKEDMAKAEEIEGMLGDQVVGIEIVWDGVLQQRYFAVPEMCQVLSDPAKDDITENVQRSQGLDLQLDDFVQRSFNMHVDLQHEMWMKSMGIGKIFNRSSQAQATWVAFFLAMFVNFISLYSLKYQDAAISDPLVFGGSPYLATPDGTNVRTPDVGAPLADLAAYEDACTKLEPDDNGYKYVFFHHAQGESNEGYKCERLHFMDNWGSMHSLFSTVQMQNVLNYVQIIVATFTMILFFIVRVPVIYRQRVVILGDSWIKAAILALTDFDTVYYIIYLIICVLALQLSPIWSSILLLDVCKKSPNTMNVLQAVIKPIEQLSLAGILAIFVLVIFAFATFLLYHEDMPDDECNTLLRCFQLTVDFGLRSSGGVGDYMSMDRDALGPRNVLDLAYFVIVLVILLNIIFGIIIDTFSELRQEKLERTDKTVNYCFVCGISKLDLDRASNEPNGFARHIRNDHYMWNYLRFIIFLQEQDQDDDDGMELYVRKCIENKVFTWFPMNRAMCMEQDEEDNAVSQQVETIENGRGGGGGGGGGGENEQLSEMRVLVEEMKKGMEEKMDKLEKQISGIGNTPGNVGNLNSSSPSFRIQKNQQMRHTTGANSPMLEAQRVAARQQAQQQAEELPPLS